MFQRLSTLIGEDNLNLLKEKNILILGAGGVGGYVVEGLVRSGIGNITVIDSDVVEESNINRQIIALHSTIGIKKTDLIEKRALDINPDININAICKRISVDDIKDIVDDGYDYVIDAIDDIKVKLELIKYCLDNDINFISSCGTAKRLDPSKLSITTLNKTSGDALARVLRTSLRGYNLGKVKVLASSEEALIKGRELGSSAFVPSVGGLMIASYVVNDIIKIR